MPIHSEQSTRIDLVAALRTASRLGLGEGICNHFSVELPEQPGYFLINPQGLHWSEITPPDLVLVDAQGHKVSGRHDVEPTAFFIHGAAHRSKPQARCVMHTHMPYATALTVIHGGQLEAASQIALKFLGRVAYDEHYNGLALDAAEGERIVAGLYQADVLFLANHGVIVTGPSVDLTFDDLYYLERACMLQVLAMSTGKSLRIVDPTIAQTTADQMVDDTQARLHFLALKRILDRDEPGWSNTEALNH
jgi:ribulose-5-phosphate 4-epimerase/fuculose-1-phosphate aldolase